MGRGWRQGRGNATSSDAECTQAGALAARQRHSHATQHGHALQTRTRSANPRLPGPVAATARETLSVRPATMATAGTGSPGAMTTPLGHVVQMYRPLPRRQRPPPPAPTVCGRKPWWASPHHAAAQRGPASAAPEDGLRPLRQRRQHRSLPNHRRPHRPPQLHHHQLLLQQPLPCGSRAAGTAPIGLVAPGPPRGDAAIAASMLDRTKAPGRVTGGAGCGWGVRMPQQRHCRRRQ